MPTHDIYMNGFPQHGFAKQACLMVQVHDIGV